MSQGRTCRVPGCENKSRKNGALCAGHKGRRERGVKEGTPEWLARIRTRAEINEYVSSMRRPELVPIPEETRDYHGEWKRFSKWLGIQKREARHPRPSRSKTTRIGAIADLHIPFHDEEALLEAVNWLVSLKADQLWIAGDLVDCYSLSRFIQYEAVPIEEEFIQTRKILDWLSREFSSIHVIEGNHEAREKKYLGSRLPPDIVNWVLPAGMLQRLAHDMRNVHVIRQRIYDTDVNWLTQLGSDCIIGHPERQSTIPLRPVEWFRDWLSRWDESLGLDRPRLIIAGHTHQAGKTWVGPCMLIETGCLCRPQGYSLTPRMINKPQRQGACFFEQHSGVTDHSSVREFYPRTKPPRLVS